VITVEFTTVVTQILQYNRGDGGKFTVTTTTVVTQQYKKLGYR